MPFAYAFKNAAVAEYGDDIAARELDAAISRVTGGKFCHVEGVLDMKDPKAALCFSARQSHGASVQKIDLSNSALWTIIPIPTVPSEDEMLWGYAMGATNRPYNILGLLQVGFDVPVTQPGAVFCSQVAFEMGVTCINEMQYLAGINPLHVTPSGKPRGGYGLFELVTGKQGQQKL